MDLRRGFENVTQSTGRRVAALAVAGLSIAACAGGTHEEYSCTEDGRIKMELKDDGTIPKRTIDTDYFDDSNGYCDDGELSDEEIDLLS